MNDRYDDSQYKYVDYALIMLEIVLNSVQIFKKACLLWKERLSGFAFVF
jgi:hypothetical protein